MRERAEQLKGQVRQAFKGSNDSMTVADALTYVDTLERLGIDNHFREEIGEALNLVQAEQTETSDSNSLHITALQFRLLRKHGLWVSEGN